MQGASLQSQHKQTAPSKYTQGGQTTPFAAFQRTLQHFTVNVLCWAFGSAVACRVPGRTQPKRPHYKESHLPVSVFKPSDNQPASQPRQPPAAAEQSRSGQLQCFCCCLACQQDEHLGPGASCGGCSTLLDLSPVGAAIHLEATAPCLP